MYQIFRFWEPFILLSGFAGFGLFYLVEGRSAPLIFWVGLGVWGVIVCIVALCTKLIIRAKTRKGYRIVYINRFERSQITKNPWQMSMLGVALLAVLYLLLAEEYAQVRPCLYPMFAGYLVYMAFLIARNLVAKGRRA